MASAADRRDGPEGSLIRGLGAVLIALLVLTTSGAARADRSRAAARLIVKFAATGEHALNACAAKLHREGRSFSASTTDRSDSVDALNERLHVRRIQPLFRGSGVSLEEYRRRPQRRATSASPTRRTSTNAAAPTRDLPDLAHVYIVELGTEAALAEALALYAADPHVEYAQPDHVLELDALPNDPFLVSNGSWGQAFADLWGLARIRAPEAWEVSRGEGVLVAVVDTGLDYLHPDIIDNVWINPGEDLDHDGRVGAADLNGIDDDQNGFVDDLRGFDFGDSIDLDGDGGYDGPGDVSDNDPFDVNGHGTHVAGTIGAVADNGIGIAGVAPGARIMAVKGFPDGATRSRDSALWRGVLYAAENGARVINNSWSCSPACPRNPLAEEVVATVHAMGVVIVTSASNSQSDVAFLSPENMREVITVSSSGEDDQPSRSFSNFGWLVDVAAPGGDPIFGPGVSSPRRNILSLRSSADLASGPFIVGADYLRNAGTSMAAPHVSGVVALMLGAEPDLGYEAIRSRIRRTAVDLGPPGHDAEMGSGRLDAWAALTDGPLPDVELAITAPRPTSRFAAGSDVVPIEGRASGDDLVSWTLEYGVGSRPAAWQSIRPATNDVVTEGVLAEWRVEGLEQGAYVIRLKALATDGSTLEEFTQISLEWNEPEALSQPGPAAAMPDVSGDLVVFQSSRAETSTDPDVESLDLVLVDLARGSEQVIVADAGDQHSVSLAGRTLAWLDEREGGDQEVRGCRLVGRTGDCVPIDAAPGRRVSTPPTVAAGRIFWIDSSTGASDLHGCRVERHGSRCDEYDLALEPRIRGFVAGDGRSLVWIEPQAGQRLARCRVDSRTGRCAAVGMDSSALAVSRPAVSGDLLAWVAIGQRGRTPLQICQLDPDTGECPIVVVEASVDDPAPSLSGDRLVWDGRVGDQNEDVFFCEFDRLRQRCPVQRLTAEMARQSASAIDGDRVVWEDDRDGATRVYGAMLPRIGKLRDRSVRAGGKLVVPIRALNAGERRLAWTVEVVGGPASAAPAPRVIDRGRGRALLSWHPGREDVGQHVLTISATTDAGLVTRRSLRIDVQAATRNVHALKARSRAHAAGVLLPGRARSSDRAGD